MGICTSDDYSSYDYTCEGCGKILDVDEELVIIGRGKGEDGIFCSEECVKLYTR